MRKHEEIRMSTPRVTTTTETPLQTWQEIAAYLGVSIRLAQSWEADGLPVRRMPGKKPRVFAVKSEIDEWRLRVTRLERGEPERSNTGAPFGFRQVSRRAMLLSAGGVIVAGAGTAWLRRPRRMPERAILEGNVLTALDGTRQQVFQYRFTGDLLQPPDAELSWRLQTIDFDRDGRRRVLAAIRREDQSEELFCFSPDGAVEWTLPCRPPLLDANAHPFEPLWRFSKIVHSNHGEPVLWIAIAHVSRFPGCVLRVDGRGTSRVQFFNAGNVQALARISQAQSELIVAAGVHNGFDQTFAAILGADDPPAVSPGDENEVATRYRFANAPKGACRAYVLFPTSELSWAHGAPYGHANHVDVVEEQVAVEVEAGSGPSYLTYSLSRALEPKLVSPSRGYFVLHDTFWRRGELNHPLKGCRATAQPLGIRRWTPQTGWEDRTAPWRLPTNFL